MDEQGSGGHASVKAKPLQPAKGSRRGTQLGSGASIRAASPSGKGPEPMTLSGLLDRALLSISFAIRRKKSEE